MPHNPLVSVVMSVYNAEKYLSACVESILCQTYREFEFIIIDDASTDGSLKLLKDYSAHDERIKLIENAENCGLTKNLNKAILLAHGEFIARMDADDICLPERFEKQVAYFLEHSQTDILGTFSSDINEDGLVVGSRTVPVGDADIKRMLPILNPISHPTVMFKKQSLSQIGFYDEQFRTSQDYDLWFRAAAAGLSFHNLPEVLFYYRMNGKYAARKSFRYRLNDVYIKLRGYNLLRLPFYKYSYILLSFVLAMLPSFLYRFAKRFDPRKRIAV